MKIVKAEFVSKIGSEDRVEAELLRLFPLSMSEEGTVRYTFHRDSTNPNRFCFFEYFENGEAMEQHMQSPLLADVLQAVGDHLEQEPVLTHLTEVKSVGSEDKTPEVAFKTVDRGGLLRWGRRDLIDQQNSYCICHKCDKFKPQSADKGCEIICSVLALAAEKQLILPVWECASFIPKPNR
jgi:quinol monooxygenase YgiN